MSARRETAIAFAALCALYVRKGWDADLPVSSRAYVRVLAELSPLVQQRQPTRKRSTRKRSTRKRR